MAAWSVSWKAAHLAAPMAVYLAARMEEKWAHRWAVNLVEHWAAYLADLRAAGSEPTKAGQQAEWMGAQKAAH